MKKYSWFLLLAFVAFACQLQNEEITLSDDASGHHGTGAYGITSTSSDGLTWTFVINQAGQHNISHMNFRFADCDGNYLNSSNVESASINGNDWMSKVKAGEGQGNTCFNVFPQAQVIKLDEISFNGIVTVVIKLDTKVASGGFLIKSATNCWGLNDPNYQFSHDCTPVECYDYQNETAWANGTRYVTRGNWATWTPYQSTSSVILYAGKNMNAGSASMSAVSGGNVTITITLGAGWSLQTVGEPVKIQGYNSTPTASNPSPGRFAHKGSSLVVTVPASNIYGIHLDVRKQIVVPCPTN